MNKVNTKKKVVVKKHRGKRIEQDAKQLNYFVQKNTFDKDLSTYWNHKGLTYVLQNPQDDNLDDDYHMELESSVEIDNDLKNRYFAGLSEEDKAKIQEIKEEYNL